MVVTEAAKKVNKRAGDILKRDLGVDHIDEENHTPETDEYLAGVIAMELREGIIGGASGEHWYDDTVTQAMEIAEEIYPGIAKDPNQRFIYTTALAITSQGETVDRNVALADQAYTHFLQHGQFPTDLKAKKASISGNLRKVNEAIAAGGGGVKGIEKVRAFFEKPMTARELTAQTGVEPGATLKDDMVYGSAMLGPKIGQGFWQNLNGNFTPITMDLWFMRAWGRITNTGVAGGGMEQQLERLDGALKESGLPVPRTKAGKIKTATGIYTEHEKAFKKAAEDEEEYEKSELILASERVVLYAKGAMVEQPKNGSQRKWITKVFNAALKKLDDDHGLKLTPAGAQATWWWPEKILWEEMGVRGKKRDTDYLKSLRALAERKKSKAQDSDMIKGTPQFAPWCEDPDPPDHWEEEDYAEMRRRMRMMWGGDDTMRDAFKDFMRDAFKAWEEELHPRGGPKNAGQFTEKGASEFEEKERGDPATRALLEEREEDDDTGLVPGDAEKYVAYKKEWAQVNDKLLGHIDQADGPEATALMRELEAISLKTQALRADPGGAAGIGLPGGARDVVVVGAGPGGLSAGINGAAEGLDTMVIEAQAVAGGQAKYSSRIENFAGFPVGISGERLTQNMFNQAKRLGASFQLGTRVESMEVDDETGLKTLTLSNGKKVESRTVILGGGLEFRKLPFIGADGPGVHSGDPKPMQAEGKDGHVLIIGGANSAAQAALGCAQTAKHVYIMSRSPIEKGMSDYQVHAVRAHPKITVIEGDSVKQLNRDESNRPDHVITAKGEKIEVDVVGGFVGSVPETKWVPVKIDRDKIGQLKTTQVEDEEKGHHPFQTQIPGVYAVGDMRDGAIGRVGVAVGEGQFALREANMYLERMKKNAGLTKDSISDARQKNNSDDPPIAELFQLDRENPWFGQSLEGVPPPGKGK